MQSIVLQYIKSLEVDLNDIDDKRIVNVVIKLFITEQIEILEDLNENIGTNYFIEQKLDFLKDCLQHIELSEFFKRNR